MCRLAGASAFLRRGLLGRRRPGRRRVQSRPRPLHGSAGPGRGSHGLVRCAARVVAVMHDGRAVAPVFFRESWRFIAVSPPRLAAAVPSRRAIGRAVRAAGINPAMVIIAVVVAIPVMTSVTISVTIPVAIPVMIAIMAFHALSVFSFFVATVAASLRKRRQRGQRQGSGYDQPETNCAGHALSSSKGMCTTHAARQLPPGRGFISS